MRTPVPIVMLALWFAAGAGPALPLLSDDAGRGVDAGDARTTALVLPSYGAYAGNLTPPGDADWFRAPSFGQDALFCVEARAAGAVVANLSLVVQAGPFLRSASRSLTPLDGPVAIGVALPPLTGAWLGVTPRGAAGEAGGTYRFAIDGLRPADLGPGDGGSGGDAGDSPLDAVALARPCAAGTVNGTSGDLRDLYAFVGRAGDVVQLTYLAVGPDANRPLEILDPTGAAIGGVPANGTGAFVLDSDGTWFLAASATAGTRDTRYVVGFANDPGSSCRPVCLS